MKDQFFTPSLTSPPSYIVKEVARALNRRAETRLRPLGLGVAYIPVMVALDRGQAKTQADLARVLCVEQPSMAQLLARMERDGLLVREPDPNHGRNRIVRLTAAGKKKLLLSKEVMVEGNLVGLQDFSPQEVDQFTHFLLRFSENLRSAK